jgi:hypothetical protein
MTLEPGPAAAGGHGHLRASTADRERAIDVLKAAFAEGRLTKDEYEERAGMAYASRTYAELGALTADLPVGPLGTLAPPPMAYHGPVYRAMPPRPPVNSLAVTSVVCALIPGIPSLIAVITGVVARRQIRETGERGSGLAAAGVTIGGFAAAMFLIYVLLIVLGSR